MNDTSLKKLLADFLIGNQAHMSFEDAVKDFPMDHINDVFPNGQYTFWDLLEHIRITQKDILDFIDAPVYKELSWPKEYWPVQGRKITKKEWDKTIQEFQKDHKKLLSLLTDKKIDVFTIVPHGTDQNFLREFLMIIDHNSYHLGEFCIMRQVMDIWK